MQVVSPRYLLPSGRHPMIDALTLEMRSCFAAVETLPAELMAILQKMESKSIDGAASGTTETGAETERPGRVF
jgi:hypothetical protein